MTTQKPFHLRARALRNISKIVATIFAALSLVACNDSSTGTNEAAVQRVLQRIDAEEARYNAFITIDREGAINTARQLDAVERRGEPLGPLHGWTLTVKDNMPMAGLPNTAGTNALRNFIPEHDAAIITRVEQAGAVIIGKTNMHELGFGITSNNAAFGPVGNAHNPAYLPGGSSGGAAVVVATNWVRASLCTDTGGSCRIPAALNGVIGFRPTVGRYSGEGLFSLSSTRGTIGTIARSMADIATLDKVISDEKNAPSLQPLSQLRLGVPRKHFYDDLDPAVATATALALQRLTEAGVQLVETNLDKVPELTSQIGFPIVYYETSLLLPAYLKRNNIPIDFSGLHAKIASPDVKAIMGDILKSGGSEKDYRRAVDELRPRLQQAYASYFQKHKVDAVIFPTTPLQARPHAGSDETVELNGRRVPTFFTYIRNTDPGSNAGLPGLSLPIGVDPQSLPIGIALDGPIGDDARLLAIGTLLEDVLGVAEQP